MSDDSGVVPAGTRVEFKVALKGRGPAVKRGATAAAPSPRVEEVPRVARLLALAHRWQRLIDEGRVRDQAEIARLTGLSRARVTQIMELRWLAPALQEALLLRGGDDPTRHGPAERHLRRAAGTVRWRDQLRP